MPDKTAIRWTGATWNPTTGCSKVSPGCAHCYAETLSLRFGRSKLPWTPENAAENVVLHPERLRLPAKWKDPRRVFVNSMSDLFHELIPASFVDLAMATMVDVDRHTYQVLTKRPELMADYFTGTPGHPGWLERTGRETVPDNIWLGTSIENDRWTTRADELRRIPVDVRFISAEPLLGPLPSLDLTGLGWVILGGESGPGYRPMDHDWARDVRDRCAAAGVAFFFKQSAAPRTEMGVELDGERIEQYPDEEPFASRRHGLALALA